MKGYTDKTSIEAYLGVDDGVTDAVLETYIEAAESIIDNITRRNFIADSTASARLYDGNATGFLEIDDAVAVTKVEVGLDSYGNDFLEVASSGADRYFLRPNNYDDIGVPIYGLEFSARDWTAVVCLLRFCCAFAFGNVISSPRYGRLLPAAYRAAAHAASLASLSLSRILFLVISG
jgi:hypothetical protein